MAKRQLMIAGHRGDRLLFDDDHRRVVCGGPSKFFDSFTHTQTIWSN